MNEPFGPGWFEYVEELNARITLSLLIPGEVLALPARSSFMASADHVETWGLSRLRHLFAEWYQLKLDSDCRRAFPELFPALTVYPEYECWEFALGIDLDVRGMPPIRWVEA